MFMSEKGKTSIYYVYEYKGNEEHGIKPFKDSRILAVLDKDIINGRINMSTFAYMINTVAEAISRDYNIEYVNLSDITILFWGLIEPVV